MTAIFEKKLNFSYTIE